MIWLILLALGVFVAIIAATVLMVHSPSVCILLMEKVKLIKEGEVSIAKQNFMSGSGYSRFGMVYLFTDPAMQHSFATAKIALRLYALSIPLGLMLGALAALIYPVLWVGI